MAQSLDRKSIAIDKVADAESDKYISIVQIKYDVERKRLGCLFEPTWLEVFKELDEAEFEKTSKSIHDCIKFTFEAIREGKVK